MSTGCQKISETDRMVDRAPGRQSDRDTDSMTVRQNDRIAEQLKSPLLFLNI